MARIPYQKTLIFCVAVIIAIFILGLSRDLAQSKGQKVANNNTVKTARVVANGDILLHDVLYASARQPDGTYNFTPYFKEVKSWIESADLAIGDYEGTISSEYPLAGYPLFNAPNEIATTMKETGYDVVDLAHNHILDSQLAGAINTVKTFNRLGLDTIGVYLKDRNKEDILI
ncbi:metallophosphatase, partial [Streptococcus agalactiae]|nr:metallophosphatase [Streptococcus agalactiae]